MTISPATRRVKDAYRVARIETFDDLKTLGAVPAHIDEKDATEAIRSDSRRYREVARLHPELAQQGRGSCNCGPSPVQQSARLRRRDFQDSFAEVVQGARRVPVAYDSLLVLLPYHHIYRWVHYVLVICPLYVFDDINVADGASLTVEPGPEFLFARDINLGPDSQLLLKGGAVHVSCASLNGPGAA